MHGCRIEKYRPMKLSEVVGNEETIRRLEVLCHVYVASYVATALSCSSSGAHAQISLARFALIVAQVFAREGNVPNLIIAVSLIPVPYAVRCNGLLPRVHQVPGKPQVFCVSLVLFSDLHSKMLSWSSMLPMTGIVYVISIHCVACCVRIHVIYHLFYRMCIQYQNSLYFNLVMYSIILWYYNNYDESLYILVIPCRYIHSVSKFSVMGH